MTLSVIVNTLNEERNIAACLDLATWADEIVVVDMQSDDRTVEIARQYTDKVFLHERSGYVEPARNYAMKQAKGDWLLILDADERITPALRAELEAVTANPGEMVAFRIPIRDYMFGRWVRHGNWKYQKLIRLVKRGIGRWSGAVHQQMQVDGQIGTLANPLDHYSHTTIARFLAKMNTYTSVEAHERFTAGERATPAGAVIHAGVQFMKEYGVYQGFRDGGHGIALAGLMAAYVFSTRIKLWEIAYKAKRGIPYDDV